MEAMEALVEQGGAAGVCLEPPPAGELGVKVDLGGIAMQEPDVLVVADAVRAALCDLMPQPRSPESIADSETLFLDLGLNSLEYLELWMSIESRLGCRFDDEDLLGDVRTVGDVVSRTLDVYRGGAQS